MALGLLDSLEDESIPGEAHQDATHARHLTNMKKFARDALLAARWRPRASGVADIARLDAA